MMLLLLVFLVGVFLAVPLAFRAGVKVERERAYRIYRENEEAARHGREIQTNYKEQTT